MLEKFLKTIHENQLIQKGEKIVIGVSGGPDSVCLLHLLWRIRKEFDLLLYSVHLNHQLRGKEAEEDAQYVQDICKRLEVPAFIYSRDVSRYSKERGISFEEAGREIRYQLFQEVLDKVGADKIAIAQNQDDQAETVLMRLIRGAGMEGLGAMDYIREDKIIRPLLDISRKEIEAYCSQYQLNPRVDRTNLESIYMRNRIRLELIPYIEKYFNPNIKATLCRTAKLLKEDNDLIESIVEENYFKIAQESKSQIRLKLSLLRTCPGAIQKRILRKALVQLSGELKNIGQVHIQNLIDLIYSGKTGSRIDLPKGIVAILEYNHFLLQKKETLIKSKDFEYAIGVNERRWIEETHGYLSCKILEREKGFEISSQRYQKHFDYDKVKKQLLVRNRRPGDRFVPLGLGGSKKLKDYFIDEKIPQKERERIPLLCDGDQIMWVIGYRMSERYKVDSDTKRILIVNYESADA